MALTLTFVNKRVLDSAVVGSDGSAHYTVSTHYAWFGRKFTTITAANGLVGHIHWRKHTFELGGMKTKWSEIRSGRGWWNPHQEYEWHWGDSRAPYRVKFHKLSSELVATPLRGGEATRFQPHHSYVSTKAPVIYLPQESAQKDDIERMFVLMVLIQSDTVYRRRGMIGRVR
ncbi:hypothetical protein R3P38DRAFT_3449310 [Favolaschia claudopus]|uniref:Uncharacterized protein n=1 Tax=Favolaschia claudopus TaxID=2862362 RepID=A0AAW0CW09_9AGAR